MHSGIMNPECEGIFICVPLQFVLSDRKLFSSIYFWRLTSSF